MDHTTMWRAQERTIEARARAAELRQARAQRSIGFRALARRIHGRR